jgi:hypothetical protein
MRLNKRQISKLVHRALHGGPSNRPRRNHPQRKH